MGNFVNQATMNKMGRTFVKALPIIFSIVGSAGVVITAVLAAKATPKALKKCEELKKEKEEELTKAEYVRAAWKPYVPAAIAGVSTMALIVASSILGKKQQIVVAGACAIAQKSLVEYRDKVKEVFGKDADQQIQELIAKSKYDKREEQYVFPLLLPDEETEDDKVLFYEKYHDQYFRISKEAVLQAEYHLNRNLAMGGRVYLNEFFQFLGLEQLEIGDELQWDVCNNSWDYYWIDFENQKVTLDDGLECYIIDYVFPPEPEEDYQLA